MTYLSIPASQWPPAGWLTSHQAAQALGVSQPSLFQSGLAEALERCSNGRVLLFERQSVARMGDWLFARRGLIALGKLPPKSPLRPTMGQWDAAWNERQWAQVCPVCNGEAVGSDDDDLCWCPEHGIQLNP